LQEIVFIAPDCVFSIAGHPLDADQRNKGLEIALPITDEDKNKYPIWNEET